jgi:hypothetical protein
MRLRIDFLRRRLGHVAGERQTVELELEEQVRPSMASR